MKTDPTIIDIDDSERDDDRPQERPVFSIESDNTSFPFDTLEPRIEIIPREKRGIGRRILLIGLALIPILAVIAIIWLRSADSDSVPVESSISDKENIELLKQPAGASVSGTTHTSDSVLGVAFDMYSLRGLRASLERELPDTTDSSLVLFMRSADYHPDGSLLGTVVIDGEKTATKERKTRPGYVAVSKEGTPVIGISASDRVADFTEKNGGDFFRQYVLLGDGELPPAFQLHGKVERAAIGRMADGELYYVVTRHRETMYDFADAMREYGFTDAVYITGGNSYDFHRTPDGTPHISAPSKEKIEKYTATSLPAPLLVFRTH